MIRKTIKSKVACMMLTGLTFFTAMPTSAFAQNLDDNEFYTLTLLTTNDIHGHVDQLPQYSTIVNQVRSEAKNVLLLDGGDLFLRGEFQEFQGLVETEILNEMGYDAWVPGNNDFRVPTNGGTTQEGNNQLKNIIEKANFDAVCANVTMKDDGSYIEGADPYVIKNVNGVKVGIIGVTSLKPQNRKWKEVSDKFFESGEITVKNIIDEVKNKSDIAIVLSHTGISTDLEMVGIQGVSAVLGADDHYKLSEPIFKTYLGTKSTPITQNGGEENHFLGRLDLVFKNINGEMVLHDFDGCLYDLSLVKGDEKIQSIIDKYRTLQKANKAA